MICRKHIKNDRHFSDAISNAFYLGISFCIVIEKVRNISGNGLEPDRPQANIRTNGESGCLQPLRDMFIFC